ncbi:MAG: DciA family protein [Candidatus Melainabacteria bacterium]|jgi:hypothetical protein|nr:DciA family protein [Candidatus Melainabacteria bacterium]
MQRAKQEDLLPIKKLFDSVARNIDKQRHYSIFQLWQELEMPDSIKKRTFAHRVTKDMKLIVGVKHSALANELQFRKIELLNLLNQAISSANSDMHGRKDFAQDYIKEVKALVFELR